MALALDSEEDPFVSIGWMSQFAKSSTRVMGIERLASNHAAGQPVRRLTKVPEWVSSSDDVTAVIARPRFSAWARP